MIQQSVRAPPAREHCSRSFAGSAQAGEVVAALPCHGSLFSPLLRVQLAEHFANPSQDSTL